MMKGVEIILACMLLLGSNNDKCGVSGFSFTKISSQCKCTCERNIYNMYDARFQSAILV